MVGLKNEIVAQRRRQEYMEPPMEQKVIICDLDGTIADWRKSFVEFVKTHHHKTLKEDTANSLMIDHDLGIDFVEYNRLKEEFEAIGSYSSLIDFPDGVEKIKSLQGDGAYLIVYTARPAGRLKRVWYDSWAWLRQHGIKPKELYIGGIERVVKAIELAQANDVIMFEDDPEFILRAASNGIPVYARRHKYNQHTEEEPLVRLVDSYLEIPRKEYFTNDSS
jgi:uncharacterized HAD superfamily protein